MKKNKKVVIDESKNVQYLVDGSNVDRIDVFQFDKERFKLRICIFEEMFKKIVKFKN